MQKVVTINLNGNAYQIDDAGYAALVAYLEGADVSLKDNPDRAEIVADLEQAIADKCQGFLGPHKTVVTAAGSLRSFARWDRSKVPPVRMPPRAALPRARPRPILPGAPRRDAST